MLGPGRPRSEQPARSGWCTVVLVSHSKAVVHSRIIHLRFHVLCAPSSSTSSGVEGHSLVLGQFLCLALVRDHGFPGGQLLPPLALPHQPSRNCSTPERCINAKKQNKIQSLDKTAFAGAGPATQRATGTQRVVHSRNGIALQGSGAFSNHSSAIPCVVCAIVVNIIGRRGALTGSGPISLLRSCSRPRLPEQSAPAPPRACSPALSQLHNA